MSQGQGRASPKVSPELARLIRSICPLETPDWDQQQQRGRPRGSPSPASAAAQKRATSCPAAPAAPKGSSNSRSSSRRADISATAKADGAEAAQQPHSREHSQLSALRQIRDRRHSQHLATLQHSSHKASSSAKGGSGKSSPAAAAPPFKAAVVANGHAVAAATPAADASQQGTLPVAAGGAGALGIEVDASPSAAAAAVIKATASLLAAATTGSHGSSSGGNNAEMKRKAAQSHQQHQQQPQHQVSSRRQGGATAGMSNSAGEAAAGGSAGHKRLEYEKPWRQNMKATHSPSPAQPDNAASSAVAAASSSPHAAAAAAAVQLLAVAANAAEPVVPKSKKRTSEEHAELQDFMRKQYQEHLKREAAEKQLAAAVMNKRQQALKALADRQREVAKQHQQQVDAGELSTWEPENSWHGVLTPSMESSATNLGHDEQQSGDQEQQPSRCQQRQQQQYGLKQQQSLRGQQAVDIAGRTGEALGMPNTRGGSLPGRGTVAAALAKLQPAGQQQQQLQGYAHSSPQLAMLQQQQQQLLQQVVQAQLQQQRQQQQDQQQQELMPQVLNPSNRQPVDGPSALSRGAADSRQHIVAQEHADAMKRAVSPGKVYIQERQAMAAVNQLAKRQFDDRIRAAAAACAALDKSPAYSPPKKAKHAPAAAAVFSPGGSSSSSRSSSRLFKSPGKHRSSRSKRAGGTKRSPKRGALRGTRLQQEPSAAAAGGRILPSGQRRQQQLWQDQLSSDEAEEESVVEEDVNMMCPSEADDDSLQQGDPDRVVAVAAAAFAGQSPGASGMAGAAGQTALAQFWAQQHVADCNASQQVLIHQLVQQSNLLKQRIELICNHALKQQEQEQQQQLDQLKVEPKPEGHLRSGGQQQKQASQQQHKLPHQQQKQQQSQQQKQQQSQPKERRKKRISLKGVQRLADKLLAMVGEDQEQFQDTAAAHVGSGAQPQVQAAKWQQQLKQQLLDSPGQQAEAKPDRGAATEPSISNRNVRKQLYSLSEAPSIQALLPRSQRNTSSGGGGFVIGTVPSPEDPQDQAFPHKAAAAVSPPDQCMRAEQPSLDTVRHLESDESLTSPDDDVLHGRAAAGAGSFAMQVAVASAAARAAAAVASGAHIPWAHLHSSSSSDEVEGIQGQQSAGVDPRACSNEQQQERQLVHGRSSASPPSSNSASPPDGYRTVSSQMMLAQVPGCTASASKHRDSFDSCDAAATGARRIVALTLPATPGEAAPAATATALNAQTAAGAGASPECGVTWYYSAVAGTEAWDASPGCEDGSPPSQASLPGLGRHGSASAAAAAAQAAKAANEAAVRASGRFLGLSLVSPDRLVAGPEDQAETPDSLSASGGSLRRRWNIWRRRYQLAMERQHQQEQQRWQQKQPGEELRLLALGSTAARGDADEAEDPEQDAGLRPRWALKHPAWAVAGVSGYRWDTTSLSSSPSSCSDVAAEGITCEMLVQQHEQQATAAPLPRADTVQGRLQPEQLLQQARSGVHHVLQHMHDDSEQQQQQQQDMLMAWPPHQMTLPLEQQQDSPPFPRPAKGDPHSVINTFLRLHQQRLERQKEREQQLLEQQEQEQSRQLLALQHSTEPEQLPCDLQQLRPQLRQRQSQQTLPEVQGQQLEHQAQQPHQQPPPQQEHCKQQQDQLQQQEVLRVPHISMSGAHKIADELLAKLDLDQQQHQQQHAQPPPSPVAEDSQNSDQWHPQAAQQSDWLERFTAQQQQQVQQRRVSSSTSESEAAAAGFASDAAGQRCLPPQQHKRLSPGSLQRLHERGLAMLESAQEAELDLLMLQQTRELTELQQEATRVARELGQQQLLALLQKQQMAAQQEQAAANAGLLQATAQGLLHHTFGHLKDVVVELSEATRASSSRRNAGVQADDEHLQLQQQQHDHHRQQQQHNLPLQAADAHAVAAAAAAAAQSQGHDSGWHLMPGQDQQQQQADRDPPENAAFHLGSLFSSQLEQSAEELSAAGYPSSSTVSSAAEQLHPVPHFQAMLMAEQAAATAAAAAKGPPLAAAESSDSFVDAAEDSEVVEARQAVQQQQGPPGTQQRQRRSLVRDEDSSSAAYAIEVPEGGYGSREAPEASLPVKLHASAAVSPGSSLSGGLTSAADDAEGIAAADEAEGVAVDGSEEGISAEDVAIEVPSEVESFAGEVQDEVQDEVEEQVLAAAGSSAVVCSEGQVDLSSEIHEDLQGALAVDQETDQEVYEDLQQEDAGADTASSALQQQQGSSDSSSAADHAASGSERLYGSSSFESESLSRSQTGVGSHGQQQQQQRHGLDAQDVQHLQQQLEDAQQQLAALSLHIDAMMVGFAVQALQATGNLARQQAIHAQALNEQQQSLAKKQQLLSRITSLQQQLGLPTTQEEVGPAAAAAAGMIAGVLPLQQAAAASCVIPVLPDVPGAMPAILAAAAAAARPEANLASSEAVPTATSGANGVDEIVRQQLWLQRQPQQQRQQQQSQTEAGSVAEDSYMSDMGLTADDLGHSVEDDGAAMADKTAASAAASIEDSDAAAASVTGSQAAAPDAAAASVSVASSAEEEDRAASLVLEGDGTASSCSLPMSMQQWQDGQIVTDSRSMPAGHDPARAAAPAATLGSTSPVCISPSAAAPGAASLHDDVTAATCKGPADLGGLSYSHRQDSLEQQQQEVAALQQLVAREQERQWLEQQKQALMQQLQEMKQLAGTVAPAAAAAALAAAGSSKPVDAGSFQHAAAAASLRAAVAASSASAAEAEGAAATAEGAAATAEASGGDVGTSYSEDFASAGPSIASLPPETPRVDVPVVVTIDGLNHQPQQQQLQQRPKSAAIPAAAAVTSSAGSTAASSVASSPVGSVAEEALSYDELHVGVIGQNLLQHNLLQQQPASQPSSLSSSQQVAAATAPQVHLSAESLSSRGTVELIAPQAAQDAAETPAAAQQAHVGTGLAAASEASSHAHEGAATDVAEAAAAVATAAVESYELSASEISSDLLDIDIDLVLGSYEGSTAWVRQEQGASEAAVEAAAATVSAPGPALQSEEATKQPGAGLQQAEALVVAHVSASQHATTLGVDEAVAAAAVAVADAEGYSHSLRLDAVTAASATDSLSAASVGEEEVAGSPQEQEEEDGLVEAELCSSHDPTAALASPADSAPTAEADSAADGVAEVTASDQQQEASVSYSADFTSMSDITGLSVSVSEPMGGSGAPATPAAEDSHAATPLAAAAAATVSADAVPMGGADGDPQAGSAAGASSSGGSSSPAEAAALDDGSLDQQRAVLPGMRPSFMSRYDAVVQELQHQQQVELAGFNEPEESQLHQLSELQERQEHGGLVAAAVGVETPAQAAAEGVAGPSRVLALATNEQQPRAGISSHEHLADIVAEAKFNELLTEVLDEAVLLCSPVKRALQQQGAQQQQQQQQQQLPSELPAQQQLPSDPPAAAAAAAAVSSSSSDAASVDTADTAGSGTDSAGRCSHSSSRSHSIQPDWQSSTGSPSPPHASPLSHMIWPQSRTAPAPDWAAAEAADGSSCGHHASSSFAAGVELDVQDPGSEGVSGQGESVALVQLGAVDGRPLHSTEAAAADVGSIGSAVLRLEPLLAASEASLCPADTESQGPGITGSIPAELSAAAAAAGTAATGDDEDDEFDYSTELAAAAAATASINPSGRTIQQQQQGKVGPWDSTPVRAELQSLAVTAAAAASGQEGEEYAGAEEAEEAEDEQTGSPTSQSLSPSSQQLPLTVDDSPTHINEYLSAVCQQLLQSLPEGQLPDFIRPHQELLSLEGYLAVEKGNPAWLELPDESHIFHKGLYDGLNEALQQLYAEAGRVLPAPGQVPPMQPKLVRPLPPTPQLLAAAQSRVLGWTRQRTRDEAGLQKLLHQAALVDDKLWADLSTELSDVAVLVAEGLWSELLDNTAELLAGMERQQQHQQRRQLLDQAAAAPIGLV